MWDNNDHACKIANKRVKSCMKMDHIYADLDSRMTKLMGIKSKRYEWHDHGPKSILYM